MKRLLYVFVAITLWGCDDFLEETSQNQIRPSTVSDMEKILEGEAYLTETESRIFNYGTAFFTDDMQCEEEGSISTTPVKKKWRRMFCYDVSMFDEGNEEEHANNDYWYVPYQRIKGCNIVLDYIGDMQGDEEKKDYLRGEAYALRGFYYLTLVNFFCLPYNYGDPSQNMGVPLKLISGVSEEKFSRGSVAGVYRQIEKDLLEGARLMRQYPRELTLFRMNGLAAYGLLSRMYLYMEQWDKVIEYADSVLNEKSDLLVFDGNTGVGKVWSERYAPDEILWGCYFREGNAGGSDAVFGGGTLRGSWTASDAFVNLFGEDVDGGTDIRADVRRISQHAKSYMMAGYDYSGNVWVSGISKTSNTCNAGIRTGEVYLNRAEAYIRKYVETNDAAAGQRGLEDLNALRRARFTADYVDKQLGSFASPQDLLDFCLRERRRELCHEGNFRWFDLRRNGMPRIEHDFFWKKNEEHYKFVLEEGDSRYVLPIPQAVLDRNSNLRQNQY